MPMPPGLGQGSQVPGLLLNSAVYVVDVGIDVVLPRVELGGRA